MTEHAWPRTPLRLFFLLNCFTLLNTHHQNGRNRRRIILGAVGLTPNAPTGACTPYHRNSCARPPRLCTYTRSLSAFDLARRPSKPLTTDLRSSGHRYRPNYRSGWSTVHASRALIPLVAAGYPISRAASPHQESRTLQKLVCRLAPVCSRYKSVQSVLVSR